VKEGKSIQQGLYMGCLNKSARLKVCALSSPTTLLSRGGHLSDIVFHN